MKIPRLMHKAWKVLCWNMRGINSDQKLLALRNAIDSSGCSVICLQETKHATFDAAFVNYSVLKNLISLRWCPLRGPLVV